MKIAILFALLTYALQSTTGEYRYKLRGPPMPPRPPPVPQYVKKWQQHLHRPPVRARPIPLHMPSSHKIPMGVPTGPRPVAPPVRTFWKTTQTSYRTPSEKKPFQSSPKVNLPEFDYHIQTNSIPTHTNPIKQVGEKGPIHTIPAPNLSLADKPIIVEEGQQQHQHHHHHHHQQQQQQQQQHQPQQQQTQLLQYPQFTQYQVTEQTEAGIKNANKLYRGQQSLYLGTNLDLNGLQAQTTIQQAEAAAIQQALQNPLQQQSFAFPSSNFETQNSASAQNEHLFGHLQDQIAAQVSPQEAYQAHAFSQQPQQQQQAQLDVYFHQQNLDHHHQQQQQQQPTQQLSNYQALINQAQAYQEIPGFAQQFQQLANQNVKQPEYHSFNYDEQNQRSSNGHHDLSSLVTAAYNLEPAAEASDLHKAVVRNPSEALAQAEYVQNYFDNRDDNIASNNVEPDAKQSDPTALTEQKKQQLLSTAFYSTLPNKKAAEALATLQAAGQINSNLMQMSSRQKNPMTIYVPDNASPANNSEKKEPEQSDYPFNESKEYDDYPQEEIKEDDDSKEDLEATQDSSQEFGDRLKPKRNRK